MGDDGAVLLDAPLDGLDVGPVAMKRALAPWPIFAALAEITNRISPLPLKFRDAVQGVA